VLADATIDQQTNYFFVMPIKHKAKDEPESPTKEDSGAENEEESEPKRKSGDDQRKSKNAWSAAEDDALLKAVLEDQQDREAEGDGDEEEDWDEIAKAVEGKSPVQCLKRYLILNRKQESSPDATSPESSKENETDSPVAKKAKRQKKESDSSSKSWSGDEIELLKKLVEQYKDSTWLYAYYHPYARSLKHSTHRSILLL
jgi:hypothetical protein